MPSLNDVRLTAIHESSHACVAVRLGLEPEFAEVRWGNTTWGTYRHAAATCRRFEAGELLGSRLMVSLAGPLGEAVFEQGGGAVNPATFFGNFESLDGDVTAARTTAERLTTNKADRDRLLRDSAQTSFGHLLAGWRGVLSLSQWLLENGLRAEADTIKHFFGSKKYGTP